MQRVVQSMSVRGELAMHVSNIVGLTRKVGRGRGRGGREGGVSIIGGCFLNFWCSGKRGAMESGGGRGWRGASPRQAQKASERY